jgi:D-alanyl-D-alanine carboxypeptidase/D-alanyl-D-alanine-endopeptidase (penicillin-binding protein 4)
VQCLGFRVWIAWVRRFGVLVLLLSASACFAAPDEVMASLRQAGIPEAHVGLMAQAVDEGAAPLVAHNEAMVYTLASTTKLVTTLAALETLGPRFKWQTRAYLMGPLKEGVLQGDLLIVGGGNARLSVEDVSKWFAHMQAKGLKSIQGNIVINRGAFQTKASDHAGTPVPSAANPHHAWPEALVLDEGVLTIDVAPPVSARPDELVLSMQPRLDGVEFLNLAKVRRVKCGALREPLTASLEELYQPVRIVVQGEWAPGCSPNRLQIANPPGSRFVPLAIAAAWRDAGGSLSGQAVQPEAAYAPVSLAKGTKPFAVHESAGLPSLLRDMNKWSNNLMARHLMLSMCKGFPSKPATLPDARKRVAEWLAKRGLSRSDLSIDNGSGLSHEEKGRAMAMVQLLRQAWGAPYAGDLLKSLPVAGEDGTLSARMKSSIAKGKAFLKTGTLTDTRALAGYVQARSGKTYAVAAIINDPKAGKGVAALDAFIAWIVDNG